MASPHKPHKATPPPTLRRVEKSSQTPIPLITWHIIVHSMIDITCVIWITLWFISSFCLFTSSSSRCNFLLLACFLLNSCSRNFPSLSSYSSLTSCTNCVSSDLYRMSKHLEEFLILSVGVVEFGTHTQCNWSETYYGVSMECYDFCLFFKYFWSGIFSWNTAAGYHCS